MATSSPDRQSGGAPPEGSGASTDQPGASTGAAVVPTSSAGVEPVADDVVQPPAEGERAVLSERGKLVVRLTDWTTREFRCTIGEGDDATPVVVTEAGVQVTKAQAQEIVSAAAAHGVSVTVESTEESK